MTRRAKKWIRRAVSLAACLVILSLIVIQVLKSHWFANYVRQKIIAATEESTGGKAEIGSFRFDWRHLDATIDRFVLHGTEGATAPPLFTANRIELRLKLLAGFKRLIDLNYLGVDQPTANVIVFPDGRTNLPGPKTTNKPNKNGLETIVALAIGRFEVSNGSAAFADQKIGFSGSGSRVQIQLFYAPKTTSYQGDVRIGALQLASGAGQPLAASVDVPIVIGKDRIELKSASIATKDSRVNVTASVSHIDQPVIDAHIVAHICLTEVQRTVSLKMNSCQSDTPCFADADVQGRFDQHSVQISNGTITMGQTTFKASGTNSAVAFNGSVSLDELGRLFQVSSKPHGELIVGGIAHDLGTPSYKLTGDILGRNIGIREGIQGLESLTLSSQVTADRDSLALHKLRVGIFGGEIDGEATLVNLYLFKLQAHLRDVKLLKLETRPTARPGYNGRIDGDLRADGNFRDPGVTGIHAEATLGITPEPQGVPMSGKVQASFDGATDTVSVGQSYLALPHSRLDLSGILGKRITLTFTSTDLDDLLPALVMTTVEPPVIMPVALRGGKLALHAEVDGSLATPQISAHIDADRFSIEQRPFDRLSSDVSASPTRAAVSDGMLTRQSLLVQCSGSVGLKQWSPDNNSPLMVTLEMHNGDIKDALALAGYAGIPARGAVDLFARVNGTLGNPQGEAHVAATNGSIYDQPFDKVTGQVQLSDQLVQLTSLDAGVEAATVHIEGSYSHPRDSMLTGHAQAHISTNGLQLSQITVLDKKHPGLNGSIDMNANVGGDVLQSSGIERFALSAIQGDINIKDLRDTRQSFGALTARADTSNSGIQFKLSSTLAGASTTVTGRTTLAKDYPTTVDTSISDLRIENALALTGETFPAKGLVAVTAHVSGPIMDLTGNAKVDLTAANIYDESINSLQATIDYSSHSIELSSLRLVAPSGRLTLNGSISHPPNLFDTGTFNFHAESDTLRLAEIRNLQQWKPGIGGTARFNGDLSGSMKGLHDISISKINANIGATGFSYNGRAYGDAKLVAETRGAEVVFNADSNFAGAVIHADGETTLSAGYPMTARFRLANARYSNLRGWLGGDLIQPGFEALLEADGAVAGPMANPLDLKGNVRVSRLELSTAPQGSKQGSVTVKNQGPMTFDYDHGSLRIQNARLTGKSTDIAITGTAGFNDSNPLNITVKANTELALLQDFERDIHASGAISVNAVVRGKVSQPLVNGTVQLKNASVNLNTLPNGISNANGVIELTGLSAAVRNVTAESGGGKIALSGFATRSGSTIRYSLNAKATHVRTRYQGISVVNSGALTLGGTSDKNLISGNVTVEKVVYNAQSDIGSMLSQITGKAAPNVSDDTSGPLFNTRLDIRIRTAPDVRFETTMAQTLQADADLTLGGTLQQPGMVGRINITQGDLIFFGNEYTVDRGSITFYDPTAIDPRLSINLETTVESITVTLGVTGPMNNLKLSYHSDPPLQFEEIVGLLTTGRRPSSDPNIVATQAAPPQQSAAEMGESALVSQAVASPLSSRLQRVFGVNQLRIDPTFASGSALPTARLSLQQRVANSVTFTYTQDVSQSNSELVRVEWAVNPRFSVVATRDENGIFGVDFFYKRQFR